MPSNTFAIPVRLTALLAAGRWPRNAREAIGSANTKTIAQSTTKLIATGGYSFLARVAPATAIAAETPQTAPPAPSVAAKEFSSPSFRAVKKIVKKVSSDTTEAPIQKAMAAWKS